MNLSSLQLKHPHPHLHCRRLSSSIFTTLVHFAFALLKVPTTLALFFHPLKMKVLHGCSSQGKADDNPKAILHTRSITKTFPFALRIAYILLFLSFFIPLLLLSQPSPSLSVPLLPSTPPSLTVVTLTYKHPDEHRNIAHNCALISRTRHRYVIYTDDVSPLFCRLCECREYEQRRCACPAGEGKCEKKNPCEKLSFLVQTLREFGEMVFLDDDVVIMKEYFLDRLAFRTRAHDFLATYGHADGMRNASYWQSFNSGLVFVRRIEGLDYGMLEKRLYETKGERDQNVVSWFVHEYYENWDTLSWKWHCRLLQKLGQDIPVDRCYTLHGHGEVDEVLGQLNRTRLRIRLRGAGGEEAGDGED